LDLRAGVFIHPDFALLIAVFDAYNAGVWSNPAWEDHRKIFYTLRSMDAEKVAKLLAAHLIESRLRLLKSIISGKHSLRARGILIS
jgi:DNA-binding GntR family transcriptional regulator